MKSKLSAALAAAGCVLAVSFVSAASTNTTYDVSFTLGARTVDITGNIVTGGTIGTLFPGNITSYTFTLHRDDNSITTIAGTRINIDAVQPFPAAATNDIFLDR